MEMELFIYIGYITAIAFGSFGLGVVIGGRAARRELARLQDEFTAHNDRVNAILDNNKHVFPIKAIVKQKANEFYCMDQYKGTKKCNSQCGICLTHSFYLNTESL